MIRLNVLSTFALALACAPTLKRQQDVWKYEDAKYEIAALGDGRIMPEGWLLAGYDKQAAGHYRHKEPGGPHLSYTRSDDDGELTLEVYKPLDPKSLRTQAEREMAEMRVGEERIVVKDNLGIPRGQVSFATQSPVEEVASQTLRAGKIEGLEIVVAQRRAGEMKPFRLVYFALARPAHSTELVRVTYENSPASFLNGLDDARKLFRRLRFGGEGLSEVSANPLLDSGEPRPASPNTTKI